MLNLLQFTVSTTPSKTRVDTASDIGRAFSSFSVDSGTVVLILVLLIGIIVVTSVVYGTWRMVLPVVALFVVGGGLLLGVATISQQKPIISNAGPDIAPQNIVVSVVGQGRVRIEWGTTSPTSGGVRYGTNVEDLDFIQHGEGKQTTHSLLLENLLVGKPLYYQLIVEGKPVGTPERVW